MFYKLIATLLTKRRLMVLFLCVIASTILWWFYSHAFISITVNNASKSGLDYSLVDQKTRKSTNFSSASPTVKRLVRRGNYEVTIQQNQTSSFAVTTTGGFLGKTKIQTSLSRESARNFVGDNPKPCMLYSGTTLLSYDCSDIFQNTQIHVPATADQPTYTEQVDEPTYLQESEDDSLNFLLHSTAQTKLGVLALTSVETTEEVDGGYFIHSLGDNAHLGKEQPLPDLNPEKTYSITAFKTGFVAYDLSSAHVLYYSSLAAAPKPITFSKVSGAGFEPYAISAEGDSVAVAYANLQNKANSNQHARKDPNGKSKIVVNQSGTQKQFTLPSQYDAISLCGTKKLCALNSQQLLEIYDIAGKKQKLLSKIGDVTAIQPSAHGLLVTRGKEITQLDVDKASGFNSYSLGDYTYCGMQIDPSGYTLCLINNKQKRVALHLDQTKQDTDSIDKKIAELLKHADVSDVSIYGTYIHVSPNFGPLIDNEDQSGLMPDPAAVLRVNAALPKAVEKIGIDTSKYAIINPYQ